MSKNGKSRDLKRLHEVLNTFGSTPDKWPAAERAGLEKLLNEERAASAPLEKDYEDAQLLDQFLAADSAPQNTEFAPMSARIMARIADEKLIREQSNTASSEVIDLNQFKKSRSAEQTSKTVHWAKELNWRTLSLLAATFIFGIYIGATLISEPAVEGVAALAGNNNSTTVEFTLFQSEPSELFGEDL